MVSACSNRVPHTHAAGTYLPSKRAEATTPRRTHALHTERKQTLSLSTAGPTSKRRTSARSVGTIGCRGWNTRLRAAAAYGCPPARPQPRVRATELPVFHAARPSCACTVRPILCRAAELPCCHAARPAFACTLTPIHSVLPGTPHLPCQCQAGPARTWLWPSPATAPRSPLICSRQPVSRRIAQMCLQGQTQTLACVWPTRLRLQAVLKRHGAWRQGRPPSPGGPLPRALL